MKKLLVIFLVCCNLGFSSYFESPDFNEVVYCHGHVKGSTCFNSLYKCKFCGSVGCDRSRYNQCTNQNFVSGKCMKCGKSNKQKL